MGRRAKSRAYTLFVSHGWDDRWVAKQMARCAQEAAGVAIFIDVFDIATGDSIPSRVQSGIAGCDELVALLTPTSVQRNWVWTEIGGVWSRRKRVSGILYGLTLEEVRLKHGGAACLGDRNCLDLNEYDTFARELSTRVTGASGGAK